METVKTYWNGEECSAVKCLVVVADHGTFSSYWARHLVGQTVRAVHVLYAGVNSYLYDEDGKGWYKVTKGYGSPHVTHKNLEIERVVEFYFDDVQDHC